MPTDETTPPPERPADDRAFGPMRDLRVPVTAVLGTAAMTVRQCLELQPDSVVALDQAAGDDLTLLVNDVPIADGEVIMLEDSTSVRVTRIAGPRGMDT